MTRRDLFNKLAALAVAPAAVAVGRESFGMDLASDVDRTVAFICENAGEIEARIRIQYVNFDRDGNLMWGGRLHPPLDPVNCRCVAIKADGEVIK